jgi:hypothetical protein
MNNETVNPIICGVCGEAMHGGYVWLAAARGGTIQWMSERPALSAWRIWTGDQGERLLASCDFGFPKTLRRAHRCPKCQTLTIEQIDKQL